MSYYEVKKKILKNKKVKGLSSVFLFTLQSAGIDGAIKSQQCVGWISGWLDSV